MIKIKIEGVDYMVATKWTDIKDVESLLKCDTIMSEVIACSNIPMSIITRLTEDQLLSIGNLLAFLNDEDEIELITFALDKSKTKFVMEPWKRWKVWFIPEFKRVDFYANVEMMSYELLETAKQCTGQHKKLYQVLISLARVYYKGENRIRHLLTYGMDILKQIDTFLKFYRPMFDRKPTDEEYSAGVDKLSGFGIWPTVYELAKEDVLKMDEVLAKPAIEIYTALFYSFRKSEYVTALYDIKFPKQPKTKKPTRP